MKLFTLAVAFLAASGLAHAAGTILVSESDWSTEVNFTDTGFGDYSNSASNVLNSGNNVGGSMPTGTGTLFRSATDFVTLTVPLPLVTGSYTSFEISYAIYFRDVAQDGFQVQYSALGDFSDAVVLQEYTTLIAYNGEVTPTNGTSEPYETRRWYVGESITVASTVTGGFTDTAKIRFASGGTSNSTWALVDDVVITAVPEPRSLALVGLGALALLSRRRRQS